MSNLKNGTMNFFTKQNRLRDLENKLMVIKREVGRGVN